MKLDFLKGYDFFTGVPDSQLKPLCNYLMETYGISSKHIIAANEGNCIALACGYHLATGKIPVVYMQNSGIGNAINPLASLMNQNVYGIPCILIIGWRGEPGVQDEPQHVYQGKITMKLLEDMDIATFVVEKDTSEEMLWAKMHEYEILLKQGRQVAFLVKKGAFEDTSNITYRNDNLLLRETIIEEIVKISEEDIIVSTTGKSSRELFEIRERTGRRHKNDFLTVGSMGHSSTIALGIALQKPDRRIWIIDGDGAALMHMGAMALIGANVPANVIHVLINNSAHESVGGMPTVAEKVDFVKIAEGCGYKRAVSVGELNSLKRALQETKANRVLSFIEVKSAIGARADLGRPTTTAKENKDAFMESLR